MFAHALVCCPKLQQASAGCSHSTQTCCSVVTWSQQHAAILACWQWSQALVHFPWDVHALPLAVLHHVMMMCREQEVTRLIRVAVSTTANGVKDVVLSEQQKGFAPYRLDNCTGLKLHLRCVSFRLLNVHFKGNGETAMMCRHICREQLLSLPDSMSKVTMHAKPALKCAQDLFQGGIRFVSWHGHAMSSNLHGAYSVPCFPLVKCFLLLVT